MSLIWEILSMLCAWTFIDLEELRQRDPPRREASSASFSLDPSLDTASE
jgi:hypothetical protein